MTLKDITQLWVYNDWMQAKPKDLRIRTFEFSVDVIRFLKATPGTSLLKPMKTQLLRSSTSIGANFSEAKDSGSVKDFRNKVLISKKEASETLYWLKLFEEFLDSDELKALQQECKEIIMILQKISTTVKNQIEPH